jgi:hypothetical protein
MKKTLGTVAAAFLLASAAYVVPAHAQNAAQPQPAPSVQTQPYGATGQTQTQPNTGTGQTMTQPYGATTQTQTYSANTQGQGQLPQGPYLGSCKDARMDGQTLIAFCEKSDRTWQTSALRTGTCSTGIENINGDLTCNVGAGVGSSTAPASPTQGGY